MVRLGDVYALVVEYAYQRGDMEMVSVFLERMKDLKLMLEPFIDEEILVSVRDDTGTSVVDCGNDGEIEEEFVPR